MEQQKIQNMKLQKNNVVFNEDEHTYTLDGKKLQGITWILSKYINPDKYASIPKDILEKAAERGHKVHKEIEMFVNGFPFVDVSQETNNFYRIAKGIEFIESEYNVTDGVDFASNIDIIDSNFNLYDIKTTYSLDKESLSWQLSIYATLFELQTKQQCGKLYGVWLHGERAEIVEIPRIDKAIVDNLLDCARNGEDTFDNPLKPTQEILKIDNEKLAKLYDVEQRIEEIEKQAEELKKTQKELRDGLMLIMAESGCKKYESEKLVITYVEPSTRTTIDSTKLKKEQPEIYKDYSKTTNTSASVRIKIK